MIGKNRKIGNAVNDTGKENCEYTYCVNIDVQKHKRRQKGAFRKIIFIYLILCWIR